MICQTAYYQVKEDAVEKVKQAIVDFTLYVKDNERGTKLYLAWQKEDDPTCFVHLFIFENEEARETHSKSDAVKKFESIYSQVLLSQGVDFTDYGPVASNLEFK